MMVRTPPRLGRDRDPRIKDRSFGFVLAMLAGVLLGKPTATIADEAGSSTPGKYGNYCGIESLHRAFSYLGKDVPFGDLVKPKYVGSKLGSSLTELKQAAEDYGFSTLPIAHVNTVFLFDVRDPLILHTKSTHGLDQFNHWVLFMGIEDGKARIYDGTDPVRRIGLEDLAELWDGNGLIVSKTRLSRPQLYLSSYGIFGLYIFAGTALVGLMRWIDRRSDLVADRIRSAPARITWEMMFLLTIAAALPIMFANINTSGFLSSQKALRGIRKQYVFTKFKTLGYLGVEESLKAGGVYFIDARIAEDYESGHLPGAINIPPETSEAHCAETLSKVSKTARLVLYCQSRGCSFSKVVGEKLASLGYVDISIYPDGWVGWQDNRKASVSGS